MRLIVAQGEVLNLLLVVLRLRDDLPRLHVPQADHPILPARQERLVERTPQRAVDAPLRPGEGTHDLVRLRLAVLRHLHEVQRSGDAHERVAADAHHRIPLRKSHRAHGLLKLVREVTHPGLGVPHLARRVRRTRHERLGVICRTTKRETGAVRGGFDPIDRFAPRTRRRRKRAGIERGKIFRLLAGTRSSRRSCPPRRARRRAARASRIDRPRTGDVGRPHRAVVSDVRPHALDRRPSTTGWGDGPSRT